MRKLLALLCLAGCFPTAQERKIPRLIEDLQHVYQWDAARGAHQTDAYLQLLKIGEEALEQLAHAILDERPTHLMDRAPQQVPVVGDVAFLIALKVKGHRLEDYASCGVRQVGPTAVWLEWSDGARARARDKLLDR